MSNKKSPSFPPIKDLFVESWERLMRNAGSLVLFGIILLLINLGLLIAFGIGIWTTGLGGLILSSAAGKASSGDFSAFASFIPKLLAWGLVGSIVSVVLGAVFKIMLFSILGEEEKKEFSFKDLFQKSLPLAGPFILLNLLLFILKAGSFLVLILPGIVVSFLFVFSAYELIYEEQKAIASLKRSAQMILQNFGEVFGRFLAYIGFYLVVGFFIPNLITKADPTTGAILGLIIRFLIGWFGMTFSISLYKQTRKNTDFEKKASILWVWLVAGLGWLMIIGIVPLGIKALNSANVLENINSEINKEAWGDFEGGDFEGFDQEEFLEEMFPEGLPPEQEEFLEEMFPDGLPSGLE